MFKGNAADTQMNAHIQYTLTNDTDAGYPFTGEAWPRNSSHDIPIVRSEALAVCKLCSHATS